MVRWRGHILHTVPYCAIVLHQNRPFPAPGQCGVIVAMMVSLILCHRWHGAIVVSWVTWHIRNGEVEGTYNTYILCHIVPLWIVLSQLQDSVMSLLPCWCHWFCVIGDMVPSWCHGWHGIYVMVRWRGHIIHTVPYCAIVLHQNRPFPAPGQCDVIVAMLVSLILCHRWHGCHRGVMGDIVYT